MKQKKLWIACLMTGVIAAAVLTGCGNRAADSQAAKTAVAQTTQKGAEQANQDTDPPQTDKDGSNILIVYFAVAENSDVDGASSASVVTVNGQAKGRVQHLAQLIQEETGGELFSIQTSVDYPGDGGRLIDYAAEEQDNDARPEITNHIENFDQYDAVFVGFPNMEQGFESVLCA